LVLASFAESNGKMKGIKLFRVIISLDLLLIVTLTNVIKAEDLAITKGLSWLKGTQNASGSWGQEEVYPNHVLRDTCFVTEVLLSLVEKEDSALSGAIEWLLNKATFTSTRDISRGIPPLSKFGADVSTLINKLTTYQNTDGSWAMYPFLNTETSILDTILALYALTTAGYGDTTAIQNAIYYILSNQNVDGGFGIIGNNAIWADESMIESNVYVTSLVMLVLNEYKGTYLDVSSLLAKASDWLISQQNEDGSFGTSIWETALAYSALVHAGVINWQKEACLNYILANQLENGSWDNDPYTTALCLRALKDSALDLIVSEISFEPIVLKEEEVVTITTVILKP
jgi:prenyltransferase beta subunit